jgi:hypothetical protein
MAPQGTLEAILDELAIVVLRAPGIASEALQEPVATQESQVGPADGRAIAAPWPFARVPTHTRTHRIERDVSQDLEEMRLGFDLLREEPLLEQVSLDFMSPVEPLRVHRVQPVHSGRQRGLGQVEQDVVVVRHQAVRGTGPEGTPRGTFE